MKLFSVPATVTFKAEVDVEFKANSLEEAQEILSGIDDQFICVAPITPDARRIWNDIVDTAFDHADPESIDIDIDDVEDLGIDIPDDTQGSVADQ